jgi:lambda family phage portal protein
MSESGVTLYDASGRAIPPKAIARQRKINALVGGAGYGDSPYDAASINSEHMALWNPVLLSPDSEINFSRDRMVARMRDLVRNDGWASGGVTRILDNAIGPTFRPIFRPDYRVLRAMSGLKTYDATWANEFGKEADSNYRNWAFDHALWCDIERGQNISGLCYTAFRHKLIDGEALAMMRYEPGRTGVGKARYATAVQLIDPDRLSNPNNTFDMLKIRSGVELDGYGAPVAYHIREAHQGDWFNAAQSLVWKRIPRETSWGRPIVIHDFERDRAAQHRGVGILAPIVERLKALVKYDGAELDAAILNSIFGAFIESPFDHSMLPDALGSEVDTVGPYQEGRSQWHSQRKLMVGNTVIPTMYPGESIETVQAQHPHGNYKDFQASVLRNISSAFGLSSMQLSQNWSDVNYSSARAALLEAWKTLDRRKLLFAAGFAHQVACTWLEESFDLDYYPLPNGAVDYVEGRNAYSTARWIGPAKGWVDPVSEKQGAWLELKMGLISLEDVAAEQGRDVEEVTDQVQQERKMYEDRGLPIPDWMPGALPTQAPSAVPAPPKVGTGQNQ